MLDLQQTSAVCQEDPSVSRSTWESVQVLDCGSDVAVPNGLHRQSKEQVIALTSYPYLLELCVWL